MYERSFGGLQEEVDDKRGDGRQRVPTCGARQSRVSLLFDLFDSVFISGSISHVLRTVCLADEWNADYKLFPYQWQEAEG